MLTDGFIPRSQVARLVPEDRDTPASDFVHNLIARLCLHALWEEHTKNGVTGFLIHDYHEYQPSRETVLRERQQSTDRVKQWRERNATRNAVTNTVNNGVSTSLVRPPPTPIPYRERERGPLPIFQGQRIVVFEWMQRNLEAVLGNELDAFGLGDWFRSIDALTATNGATDTDWPWLRKQLIREIRKRGITLDSENAIREREKDRPRAYSYPAFDCPHDPKCSGRHACHTKQQLGK